MIQTLHFLSGVTLLLINYLVVNSSVMRNCGKSKSCRGEKKKRNSKEEETRKRCRVSRDPSLRNWRRHVGSVGTKTLIDWLYDKRCGGQTIALIDWSCLALREPENTLRLSATITRRRGCCQRANSSVIIPLLPVESA